MSLLTDAVHLQALHRDPPPPPFPGPPVLPNHLQLLSATHSPPPHLCSVSGIPKCRQWSGVNGVTFFAPQIFAGIQARLGAGNQGPLVAAILVNGVQLIATIFTVIMVDKIGRRSLLLSGSLLGFAAEVAVAIVLAVSASTSAAELPLAASVVSIVLVSACACTALMELLLGCFCGVHCLGECL